MKSCRILIDFFSYRTSISRCSHLLVDEIWMSLLENTSEHIVIIQLLSALVQGYRLFDLNIPRNSLLEKAKPKYEKTLEKLSKQINDQMVCIFRLFFS